MPTVYCAPCDPLAIEPPNTSPTAFRELFISLLATTDGLEALATAGNASLNSINLNTDTIEALIGVTNTRLPAATTPGLLPVDALATPLVPRNQNTSATATAIVLTTTARRISMYATAGTWYSLTGAATSASHYIAASERLDFNVPASTTVSVLQETAAGVVRISELG